MSIPETLQRIGLFLGALVLLPLLICACNPIEHASASRTPSDDTVTLARRITNLVPGSRVILVADTGSMEPTLDGRTVVVIAPAASYAVGDIVVFRHEGGLIVHRVREVSNGRLWTKGDANARRDGFWVNFKSIEGKVICIVQIR